MSNDIKPIVLKARAMENSVGVVRLTPEAGKVVRRLCSRSGPPIKTIVSEIIIQFENLIDIDLTESEEDDQ